MSDSGPPRGRRVHQGSCGIGLSFRHRLRLAAPEIACRLHDLVEPGFAVPVGPHAKAIAISLHKFVALVGGIDLCQIAPEMQTWVRARQVAHVAGRVCAELALCELGRGDGVVARGSGGEPSWPPGWVGSIAHSHDMAVATAAPAHVVSALGVDVERVVDHQTRRAVESTCLTASEVAWTAGTERSRAIATTLLFSAKEAYYKAIYPKVRRYVDFLEAEVRSVDWAAGTFAIGPLDLTSSSDLPFFSGRFSIGDGWVTTCCEQAAGCFVPHWSTPVLGSADQHA